MTEKADEQLGRLERAFSAVFMIVYFILQVTVKLLNVLRRDNQINNSEAFNICSARTRMGHS